jgi:hypothetical protein
MYLGRAEGVLIGMVILDLGSPPCVKKGVHKKESMKTMSCRHW